MSSSSEQVPAPSGSPPRSPEDESKTKGKYRFEVAVLALATMIFAVCILQALATSEFFIVRLAVLPMALFLAFFGYEWVTYFSDALTRRKRAYFDVRNILETYQPRRNTDLARQFKPDPPTPSVSNQPTKVTRITADPGPNAVGEIGGGAKKDFAAWRREHYENEYAVAMQARAGQVSLYEPTPGEVVNETSTAASDNGGGSPVIPVDSIEQYKAAKSASNEKRAEGSKDGKTDEKKEESKEESKDKAKEEAKPGEDEKKKKESNEPSNTPEKK
uniref:Uncharacterized protein n=1 Tax=Meloidogyne enterolobii TaxID=390850 RepID=A0A6V7WE71_MELEN|nr:unnamed protein product [Meloidogyne enterolobii]